MKLVINKQLTMEVVEDNEWSKMKKRKVWPEQ